MPKRSLSISRHAGFGTILIQARIALPREDYLSDAYLAAYRLAIGIAAELGLKAGIYDDYNWISGHAGGRTVESRDELRERHLFWSSSKDGKGAISGIHAPFTERMGPEIFRWQYEGSKVEWCEWTLEAALLHPSGAITDLDQITDVTKAVRITASDPVSCRFEFDGAVPAESGAHSICQRPFNDIAAHQLSDARSRGLASLKWVSTPYREPSTGSCRTRSVPSSTTSRQLVSIAGIRSKGISATASSFLRTLCGRVASRKRAFHSRYRSGRCCAMLASRHRRLRAQFYAAYSVTDERSILRYVA